MQENWPIQVILVKFGRFQSILAESRFYDKLTIFLKFNPRSLISPSKVSFDIRVIKFFDKFKTSKYSIGLLTISKIVFRNLFFGKNAVIAVFIIIQFETEG